MANHRTGLHKDISSIFDGVPLPNCNEDSKPSGTLAAECNENAQSARDDSQPSMLGVQEQTQSQAQKQPQAPAQPTPMQKPPQLSRKIPKMTAKLDKFNTEPGLLQKYLDKIKDKLLTPQPGVSPAKHMTMVVLMPVLSVIMIFVFSKVLFKGSVNKANADDASSNLIVAKSSSELGWKIPEPYPANLRDPMRLGTISTSAVQTGGLIVTAIVYTKENPSAVIDTQIVHEGDQIFGATIIKINLDSVEFEKNGKKWTQPLQD